MDLLDSEILQLWSGLHRNEVAYIMVGGFATNLHGFSRTTADMDIWIRDTVENRIRLISSLEELGLHVFDDLKDTQLIPGRTSIKLPSGFELYLMTFIEGFPQTEFEACLSMASIAEIEGIPVRFLHLNQLIQSKEATHRPKDQIDLIELRRIQQHQSGKGD